ncbi:peptidase family M1-domain-containing protein [Chytriomyces cf. hyalinus JEL632]|nr:peptidase family M1-domain-containing protein [Chytriomyces cf. hyalinus JEL632]
MCLSNELSRLGGASSGTRDLLPGCFVPTLYRLSITPNLETFVFSGTVEIHVTVKSDSSNVVLNAKNLKMERAVIDLDNNTTIDSTGVAFDSEKETVTFEFGQVIPSGTTAVFKCQFTGTHNDNMAGFYKASYSDEMGNKRYFLATQFCATDARQCFPCFDEPALKAVFEATLVVDQDLVALSNMNDVKNTLFESKDGKKLKEVVFAPTPVMSSYLVAFVVGDLESIEAVSRPENSDPIHVRVFTLKGKINQGQLALRCATKTLEYFSTYFNEAYPLPKSDLVAIPDHAFGAMENWGLVTYRNSALLCDEATATADAKKGIAYTVAHELAHQWFGNLVTMSWWNDIWLNEGFATFVGWMATDFLYPEWQVWTGYVTSVFSRALSLDGLRSSHPINVQVNSATEVMEIFDAISYLKGSSVIRMLNEFLGSEVFMNGIRSYIQEFKYKNAVTDDLWRHLSNSSGLDIGAMMNSWTEETGFPLVTVEKEEFDEVSRSMTITLSQDRFLSAGGVLPDENKTIWWVPIRIGTHLKKADNQVLSSKGGKFTFPYEKATGSFWKLNLGATTLTRVKYSQAHIAEIAETLKSHPDSFSVGDRIMLLSDALELSMAGLAGIDSVLDTIKALQNETDYTVLDAVSMTLATLRSVAYLETNTSRQGLESLGRSVFSSHVAALGFDFPQEEEHFQRLKRGLAIDAAELSKDQIVIDELKRRFDLFVSGNEDALHPELRAIAFRSVLSHCTEETAQDILDSILTVYKDPKTQAAEATDILRVLGAVKSNNALDRILSVLIFNQDIVRTQDFATPLQGIARYSSDLRSARPLLLQWMQQNWGQLRAKFEGNGRMLGSIFSACVATSIGDDVIASVEGWVRGDGLDEADAVLRTKDCDGFRRGLNQALEGMHAKTAFINRESTALAAWVSANIPGTL